MASRTARALTHPSREALRFTDVAAALSDPVRLAIVAKLADATDDGELACATFDLPVSKSTQSGHFHTLREAGVIWQRDEGTRRLNRLRRDDLDARFPGLLDLAIPHGRRVIESWVAENRCQPGNVRQQHRRELPVGADE